MPIYIEIDDWVNEYGPLTNIDTFFTGNEEWNKKIRGYKAIDTLWIGLEDGTIVPCPQDYTEFDKDSVVMVTTKPVNRRAETVVVPYDVAWSSEKLDHEQMIRSELGGLIYFDNNIGLRDGNLQAFMQDVPPEAIASMMFERIKKLTNDAQLWEEDEIFTEFYVEDNNCVRVWPEVSLGWDKNYSLNKAIAVANEYLDKGDYVELYVYDSDGEEKFHAWEENSKIRRHYSYLLKSGT